MFKIKKINDAVEKSQTGQMKIILITQGISLIVNPVCNSDINVVGIIESAPRKDLSKIKKAAYSFFDILSSFLKNPKKLKSYCRLKNMPYFYLTNHNTDECCKWVQKFKPDLIVVYLMSQLLPEKIFLIPKYGTINLHPSFLPEYRGPNPYFWMYHNMEEQGGVTVHYVDKGEDTGDIILQDIYSIPTGIKLHDLTRIAICQKGLPLFMKALELIKTEEVSSYPQPLISPTKRARNVFPDEYNDIIDWKNDDTVKIWHILRGYSDKMKLIEPPGGIFTGQKWEIMTYSLDEHNEMPSKNVRRNENKWCLFCKNGLIHINLEFKLSRLFLHILKLS